MSNSASEARDLLQRFSRSRIAVIGDLALDEFVLGRTSRVSREAPVLILRHVAGESWPGCAGNTARNVAALGGEARLVGCIGKDEQGRLLQRLLVQSGVGVSEIVQIDSYQTWTKSRFLAGDLHTVRQQVMRLDREPPSLDGEARQRLHEAIRVSLQDAGAVLLSDYGGGVLSSETRDFAIGEARKRQIPIVADSRYALAEFTGITCATPNETEIEPWVGFALESDDAVARAGFRLMDRLQSDSLIITRGQLGMTLFEGKDFQHLPAYGKEAVDVAGAGDTVAATVALTLAAGGSVAAAAKLANYAASRVVQQRGTAVTSQDEIAACLQEDTHS